MKNLFPLTVFFALLVLSCSNGIITNPEPENEESADDTTTLTIKNESGVEITDVLWNNVPFTGNQLEMSIKPGTSVTNPVQAGVGYIYFKRKSNPVTARTRRFFEVKTNGKASFTFIDNTDIVEVNNTNNTGMLASLQSTIVWWDDAEGEIQPYYLMQNDVEYYSGSSSGYSGGSDFAGIFHYMYYRSPKNGGKSIRIGGTNTALLHIKINLAKKARLSFWYANYHDGTDGAAFSINGEEKIKWVTDINWSQMTYNLEPGENNLIWEKKDGYRYAANAGARYFRYYLSLDDILISYME